MSGGRHPRGPQATGPGTAAGSPGPAAPAAGAGPGTGPGADGPDAAGPGRLVLGGTPLGRPSDASPGLVALLSSADVIAAEDTRRLLRLAAELGVELHAPVVSYYESVEQARIPALLDRLAQGGTVALVTDAGMPSVSDPGYRLVAAAAEAGHLVTAVPGPSAVITALALSGLPSDRFCFEGFPPRKAGARAAALAALAGESRTMVFFESVHRIGETLAAMVAAFGGDRPAALCRELTKTYEEVRRGSLAELAAAADGLRGEITLVVAGRAAAVEIPADADLAAEVDELVTAGSTRRDAVETVAVRRGVGRREVYRAAHA